MDYVTDTHSMLWHLFLPQRLGHAARSVFAGADAGINNIYIPAVVVAEMIMVVQRGRLAAVAMPQLLSELQRMEGSSTYRLLPLLPSTVISSHALTNIPDIFDRLIVAEAQRLGFPLLSRDTNIRDAGIVPVVWDEDDTVAG